MLYNQSLIGQVKSKPKKRALFNSSPKLGTVVVKIWVDNYGVVQKAIAGVEGTTVTDKDLWNAARIAAKKASFNMSADAPALQEGTITYIFKLR